MIPGGGGDGGGGGVHAAGAISPYLVQSQHGHGGLDGMDDGAAYMGEQPHCHALLYNLSVLKDRVHQLHPLVALALAHNGHDHGPLDVSAADAIIQEIVAAASSMMYAFQLLCDLGTAPTANINTAPPQEAGASIAVVKNNDDHGGHLVTEDDHLMHQQQWQQNGSQHDYSSHAPPVFRSDTAAAAAAAGVTATATDTIIELDAAELLAKFTHYCQVCGKGFKRDANLRMHMRAHGDEYKSKAALSNPTKLLAEGGEEAGLSSAAAARKYSCPQEGCRWNRRHAKFQPLKSVICAKNHYKRSHCPKMYVCNRCGRKHFSVLSDLRTHEKHCGDHRWLCSCGTSFSRKDKLIGHVALFAGHQPVMPLDAPRGKRQRSSSSSASASVAGNIDDATGIGMGAA